MSRKPHISFHCRRERQAHLLYTVAMEAASNMSSDGASASYSQDTVSLAELRRGRVQAARLVRRYGPIYWPVVERLQAEITSRESREALLSSLLEG